MRLIDADALVNNINESIENMTRVGVAVDGAYIWALVYEEIKYAPTIEPSKMSVNVEYDVEYLPDKDGVHQAKATITKAEPSGDLISRADAIDRLNEIHREVEEVYADDFDRGTIHGLAWAIDILKGLPSADTMSIEEHQQIVTELKQSYTCDRPKGEWIRKENNVSWWVECSKCGEKPLLNVYNHTHEKTPYCPHCGADMRGEDDG